MPRLVINPGADDAWEQELPPGTYAVGRSTDNDLAIEHPSISSLHCQLIVSETGAALRDLGSTNGTFIDGQLVEEAVLRSGQTFCLGEVALQFEAEVPEVTVRMVSPGKKAIRATTAGLAFGAPQPAASAAFLPSAGAHCKTHPRTAARYSCPKCGQAFCEICVSRRRVDGISQSLCRACGSPCQLLPVATGDPKPPPGFFRQLPSALSYPLKGNGLVLIVAGGVFFLLVGLLPILGLLLTGYLFGYAKRIVAATAEGTDEPPDWPDFTNWVDDILVPYFHMVALVILSFGPAILLNIFLPESQSFREGLLITATVLGAFLAPMGMISVSIFDTVGALNPVALVWSISRIPLHYLAAAAAFELVIAAYMSSEDLIGAVVPWPWLAYIICGFLNLYLLAAAMRILGLLYRSKKTKLGWFRR